jgi:hypothetical protein
MTTIVHFFASLIVLQFSIVLAATLTGMKVRRMEKVVERDATTPIAGRRIENSARRF